MKLPEPAPLRLTKAAIEPPQLIVPSVRIPRAETEIGKQGVHTRGERVLRGAALRADAIDRMLASVSAEAPTGMTTAALAALYTPPLKQRTAEELAAAGRKAIRESVNGHAHPEGEAVSYSAVDRG